MLARSWTFLPVLLSVEGAKQFTVAQFFDSNKTFCWRTGIQNEQAILRMKSEFHIQYPADLPDHQA